MVDPLHPLTALGHAAPETRTFGPWTVTERADVALASLAGRKGRMTQLQARAESAGIPLTPPSRHQHQPPYGAFWLAPDMWMIEAPYISHEDIAAHLVALFGDAASVTEQTDAWVRFDLSGASLVPVLERLSNLDLATLPDGFASRTVIDHLGVYLIRHGLAEITLYGPRSSARDLLHALEVAALSVA